MPALRAGQVKGPPSRKADTPEFAGTGGRAHASARGYASLAGHRRSFFTRTAAQGKSENDRKLAQFGLLAGWRRCRCSRYWSVAGEAMAALAPLPLLPACEGAILPSLPTLSRNPTPANPPLCRRRGCGPGASERH